MRGVVRLTYQPYGRTQPQPQTLLAFAYRKPRGITVAVAGRGINLHRLGGVSITGLPKSGGSTLAWGFLRRRCERMDREARAAGEPSNAWVATFGHVMLRVGEDF